MDQESPSGANADESDRTPTRLCPKCSSLAQTTGDFCPHCGASYSKRTRGSRRAKIIATAIAVAVVLGSAGAALGYKIHHDHVVSARQAAQVAAAKAARDAALAAAAVKRAETKRQIAVRHADEREMRGSITTWARKQVNNATLDGPILRTSCTPVGGGSENLSEITVKYDCLAITKDNADGTSEGYRVHATMDFSKGEYQWGLGNG
jgi:hypothetical protein